MLSTLLYASASHFFAYIHDFTYFEKSRVIKYETCVGIQKWRRNEEVDEYE